MTRSTWFKFPRARHRRPGRRSRGFTLVELMIGLLVSAIVIVISLQVLVSERRSAEARKQEMNAQQNLRVALDNLNREIRMVGLGIDEFDNQPRIIDAGPWQLAFNADISSGVGGAPSMAAASDLVVSGGGVYSPGDHPGENLGGLPRYNGGAETIVYGMDEDIDGSVDAGDAYTNSENPIDFALYRRTNEGGSDRVAFGLRGPLPYPDGTRAQPLFKYWGTFAGSATARLWGDTNNNGSLSQSELQALTPVSVAELSNVIYVDLDVATFTEGEVARMGHAHGTDDDPFNYLEINGTSRVRPRNIGVNPAGLDACGNPPAAPTGLWVEDTPHDAGSSINVNFSASADEAGGEEDVTHYYIYRRAQGEPYGGAIGQVLASGAGPYMWKNDIHTDDPENIPEDGINYYYRVTAWDCRPQESNLSSEAGPVQSVPNGVLPPALISVYDVPCDTGGQISVVFSPSPDEVDGAVTSYYIYRGPTSGDIINKTLVGMVTAANMPVYVWNDNEAGNIAGAPPLDGSEYWYLARALCDTISSVNSNEIGPVVSDNGLAAALLETVIDLPYDDGTALRVKWRRSLSEQCVPNLVDGYYLQRKGPAQGAFVTVATINATGVWEYERNDTGLTPGLTYTYRVVTYGDGDEIASNTMDGVPTVNEGLLPPTDVVAQGVECDPGGAILLTWTGSTQDNGSGIIDHYRIYRRIQGSGNFGLLASTPASGLGSYEFENGASGPSPPVLGTTYEYVVTSYNETLGVESIYSNQAVCTSSAVPGAPLLTQAIDTPDDNGGSISIRFNRSEDDGGCTHSVVSYHVYRSVTWGVYNGPPVGTVTASGAANYLFFDNGAGGNPPVDGTSYYYIVRAYDGDQESENSNQLGPVMSEDNVPNIITVFSDGFEASGSWTHGGTNDDWERGDPTSHGMSNGNADPNNAYAGSRVYGTDLGNFGADGAYRSSSNSWLMSPAVNCSTRHNVQLVLQYWLNVESPSNDQAYIDVSPSGSGGPWTNVWVNSSQVTHNSWHALQINISAVADGRSDVRVRFRLRSNSSREYAGWNIDELSIIADQ